MTIENDTGTPAFNADRWGAQWAEEGVVLRFGAGSLGTAIRLDPTIAAALAADLKQCLRQHETAHGTVWSEHHNAHGAITDARLDGRRIETGDAHGLRLYRLVRNLPLNGFERSFKMLERQLCSERFLVGIDARALAPADFDALAAAMDTPAPFRQAMLAHMPHATFIHIGFEKSPHHSVYKLYQEFAQDDAMRPLYLGYKWDAQDNSKRAISRYTQPAPHALPALLRKVAAVYTDTAVAGVAEAIVTLAAQRAPLAELLFVEVTEEDTPRVSFDINLYQTGLRVRDLAPMLAALSDHLSIPGEEFAALMARTGDDLAGHLSGGTDRGGNAFLTTYHARTATAGI